MAHDIAREILALSESKCTAVVTVALWFKSRAGRSVEWNGDDVVMAIKWQGPRLLLTKGGMTFALDDDARAHRLVCTILREVARYRTEPERPGKKVETLSHAWLRLLPGSWLEKEEGKPSLCAPVYLAGGGTGEIVEAAARRAVEYMQLARDVVV